MDGFPNSTKAGTLGGTFLVVIIQINAAELLKTAVLAAIGASVSFGVTVLLKWVIEKARKVRK